MGPAGGSQYVCEETVGGGKQRKRPPESAGPASTAEYRSDAASLVIPVTPWGACAAAALMVSAAALFFTLGRLYSNQTDSVGSELVPGMPEQAGRLPAVDYEQLQIDPGSGR